MAAVESARLSHLASQPPKGFNVLHPFRIPPLNDHKDKKLISEINFFSSAIIVYFFN
jgi:hypothetical protein